MPSSSVLWTVVSSRFEKLFRIFLLALVSFYRSLGTAHLGGACRFTPSCSAYALEALHSHPSHKAFWYITKRICNCRPGGGCGYDPVPPAGGF